MNQTNSTNTSRRRLPPKMSEAKADWLRQTLKSRISETSITSGAKQPIAFVADPCECIITNLSKLSRGLRNRVIKEYINNNPIVNTLTCPHPSGYFRNIPCPYCYYGNSEVVKIEKLTRYFICKFRKYKQQFRGNKNRSKNKSFPSKTANTVPSQLLVQNNDVTETEYRIPILNSDMQPSTSVVPINEIAEPINKSPSLKNENTVQLPWEAPAQISTNNELEILNLSVSNDMQQPILVAPTNEIVENIIDFQIEKTDDAPIKINLLSNACTAVGDDHTICNNEPLKNQAELKLFSSCLGLINLECPKQDLYQLGGKYNTFYKHSSMYGNVYFDMSRHNKISDAYWDEIEDDHGVKRHTDAQSKEIAKMYCTDGHGFHSWIFDLSQEHKDIPLQQKRDIIIKRIDYELALDDLFNNKPNATLQEVTELYKQYHP
ncbi:unnamed protein product [Rotaria magnacalcarata]|nr:unnamed protein product [Rotaria magnacalcarata]